MAEDRKFKFENGQFINRVSGEAIPDDEPVMIFRARDRHALAVLAFYRGLVADEHHKQAVDDRILEFTSFAEAHAGRMKEPGITQHIQLNTASTPPPASEEVGAMVEGALKTVSDRFPDWEPSPAQQGFARAVAAALLEKLAGNDAYARGVES